MAYWTLEKIVCFTYNMSYGWRPRKFLFHNCVLFWKIFWTYKISEIVVKDTSSWVNFSKKKIQKCMECWLENLIKIFQNYGGSCEKVVKNAQKVVNMVKSSIKILEIVVKLVKNCQNFLKIIRNVSKVVKKFWIMSEML